MLAVEADFNTTVAPLSLSNKCECGTVMDRYTRHMKLQGLRKNGLSHDFISVFDCAQDIYTKYMIGKKRRQTKEHAVKFTMPCGKRNVRKSSYGFGNKHASEGGNGNGVKAQNERLHVTEGAKQRLVELENNE